MRIQGSEILQYLFDSGDFVEQQASIFLIDVRGDLAAVKPLLPELEKHLDVILQIFELDLEDAQEFLQNILHRSITGPGQGLADFPDILIQFLRHRLGGIAEAVQNCFFLRPTLPRDCLDGS